jgi:hypothetical protein
MLDRQPGMGPSFRERRMKFLRMIAVPWLLIASAGCGRTSDAIPGFAASAAQQAAPPFLVKPYLQWVDSPTWESGSGIQLLWQDEDVEAGWTVECYCRNEDTHKF